MGTVGLSFGSPTSGQGFDVTSTVSQIVTNMQAVETPWKNQLSALQSQDTALSSIGSDLSSLSSALQSLTDFEGVLSEKQGSSSDTSVLQLTSASTSAIAGSHTITVQSLATTSSYVSSTVSSSSDTLTGSLSINGQTINIDSTNNTLTSLASAINSGSYGVIANVITDSSGSRLSLVSKTSGASGAISVSSSLVDSSNGSSAVNFTQTQAGADAKLTVDGVSISSSSNTVTNAIQGVTFQLLSPSANGEQVQVIITNSNSAVESAINSFVSAYNKVVQDLNTQEGKDSSGNPEPLYGSPTLATLQEALQSALNFTQTSGAITSLSQLGITAGNDGTLTVNSDTLDSMLNTNYQDVVNFFQPSGTFTSFGGNLTSVLNNLSSSSTTGAIELALQQNASVEQQLNQNISNEENIINAKKSELTTQLNEANYILTSIPQQLQQIDEIYSAITGYNQKQ
ncbi:MAG: flagellar filament capping protein FliD [Bacillota bacterium]|nr:flagellar filament capping protein FliD [Bacillota bacterium]